MTLQKPLSRTLQKSFSRNLTGAAALTITTALGATFVGPAQAQTTVPPASSTQTIPEKSPATSQKLKQEQGAPSVQNGRSDSLSTQLNRSNGVISPKTDVDPGMKAPVPSGAASAATPVIPPSATGGGNAK